MSRQQVLDLYFLDARSKLLDIAAFLDRVDRADGEADFRFGAFREALTQLSNGEPAAAERLLRHFSDSTTEPLPATPATPVTGAWRSNS